jgi:glutaryl-CoA dehydrogenase
METRVQPIINKYWSDDAFPFELLPSFKELGIGGLGFEGYGCAGGSQKLFGFVAMELARVDASFCTFFGVHSGLLRDPMGVCGTPRIGRCQDSKGGAA